MSEMRSDDKSDVFFYRKDRCRDHLNCVTPKEGFSDLQYGDIILQSFQSEYDRTC